MILLSVAFAVTYFLGAFLIYAILDIFFSNTFRFTKISASALWVILAILVLLLVVKRNFKS